MSNSSAVMAGIAEETAFIAKGQPIGPPLPREQLDAPREQRAALVDVSEEFLRLAAVLAPDPVEGAGKGLCFGLPLTAIMHGSPMFRAR